MFVFIFFRNNKHGKRIKKKKIVKYKNCCRTNVYIGYTFIHYVRKRYHHCHDMQLFQTITQMFVASSEWKIFVFISLYFICSCFIKTIYMQLQCNKQITYLFNLHFILWFEVYDEKWVKWGIWYLLSFWHISFT